MRHTVLLSPKCISFECGFSKRRPGAFAPCRTVLLLACIALAAGLLVAQTFFGSIVGTITDSSGASVVNAKVGLTNTATGERRATTSGADGNYQFVNLIPGLYRIDVENAGFKHLTRDSIEVQVQATVRVDGVMQLGDVGQTVEVGAQIPLLQTETYSLGTVVDQRKVQEMPLNGRNVLNLVTLVPGVVAQGSALANQLERKYHYRQSVVVSKLLFGHVCQRHVAGESETHFELRPTLGASIRTG
jgi:hypothetical protein